MAAESLASGRGKRSTAGAKMAKLLDNEEEDEFYKSTYGGFNDEEDDNDYASEASDDDQVDSDFDIDENDEMKSDVEDVDEGKRKKKAVSTKAYKEPVKRKANESKSKPAEKKKKVDRSAVQIYFSEKKSVRKTTSERTKEAELKRKEAEAKKQMMKDIARKKNVAEVRRLTQEELLEEAKITEEINLRSLETYNRMELERRKTRVVKQAYCGPMIRYHSVSMPLIQEVPDQQVNVEENSDKKKTTRSEQCSRTFITFTDEKTAAEIFPCHRAKPPPKQQLCPVTRLPAKYFDPITKTPFATCQAFKILRSAYTKQLEGGERRKSGKQTVPQQAVAVQ